LLTHLYLGANLWSPAPIEIVVFFFQMLYKSEHPTIKLLVTET
jgi:hypothetical protein